MVLDPLGQLNAVTIGAVVAIFLATFWLVRRSLLPLIEVMERRTARIAAARAQKAEAEVALRGAQAEAASARAAATGEVERAAATSRDEVAEVRRARLAQATAEAEAIAAAGREEVLALRQAEEAKLADELYACVRQALTKMIGPVDETAVRFMVGRVLAAKEAR